MLQRRKLQRQRKRKSYKGKGKRAWGLGKGGVWAVDGEGTGDWNWPQPEEDKAEGSIESVERSTEKINIDEEGYETVRRPRQRTLGQHMPEIFAVEAEKPGKSK